jgi:TonB family protein
MLYLFQTIVYSTLLYLVYALLLKGKPNHRFNRFFLLLIAATSFVLPLFRFQFLSSQESLVTHYLSVRLPNVIVANDVTKIETTTLWNNLLLIYFSVVILLVFIHAYQWWKLHKKTKQFQQEQYDGYTLLLNTNIGPASFGQYIFLPENEINTSILEHEIAHIKLKHTNDLLFMAMLRCFFWYNPIVHFIYKELQQVHEFEADSHVTLSTPAYQELLVTHLFKECSLPFTHSFINHPLKRRIMMLNKNNKKAAWHSFTAFTLVCFLVGNIIWFQSAKAKNWVITTNAQTAKNETEIANANSPEEDTTTYKMAYKMPEPTVDFGAFLSQQITYPPEAKKNNIQGRVVIKFVVNKKGEMVNFRILKSPDPLLTKEALRVLKLAPNWIPGENEQGEHVNVYFTLPIEFQLDQKS